MKWKWSLFTPVLVLVVISSLSGWALSYTYQKVQPRIKREQERKLQQALTHVFPHADAFQPIDKHLFSAFLKKEKVGHVALTTGKGYSSNIETLVGVDLNHRITGIQILSQLETPGLGSKITEPWFQNQFKNQKINEVSLKRKGGRVDQISGATISCQVVVDSIRKIKKHLESIK